MTIDIRMTGPLFDGRAARAMDRACDDARDEVAAYAEERVLMGTSANFRTRTPYYETRVTTERVSGEVSLVHDQGVIYGPWLEGVGSRNRPRPGFPGYGFWRLAKQATAARGPQIAELAVRRRLPEMGG